jgi:hypothetical protein
MYPIECQKEQVGQGLYHEFICISVVQRLVDFGRQRRDHSDHTSRWAVFRTTQNEDT